MPHQHSVIVVSSIALLVLEISDDGKAFWYFSQPNVLYDLTTTLISQFFN